MTGSKRNRDRLELLSTEWPAGLRAPLPSPLPLLPARPRPAQIVDDTMRLENQPPVSADTPIGITLTINGQRRELQVAPWTTLLDLLRERLDLTGTKKGCDHGQCGACTVLVNGTRVNSCLTLAVMKDGAEITTVEGLASLGDRAGSNALHPIQEAFIEHDAFQCGYCTPGQLCSSVGLMNEGHAHTRDEIREAMSGNICRCGAYTNIVDAIEDVMQGGAR
jgi:xanthine dehydrogenase YagT iron-sulfur-binding subunit